MSWRSRWWWAVALVASAAEAGYILSLRDSAAFFGGFYYPAMCPGWDAFMEATVPLSVLHSWMPPVWYGGLPAVVVAFLAHWISIRVRRPRIGRVVSRVLAALLLVAFSTAPLALALDIGINRSCLGLWGGPEGAMLFVQGDLAPMLAALCMLAAVRTPRHRIRRLLTSRPFRRGTVILAALGLLALLPAADLMNGPIAPLDHCPTGDGTRVLTGERAYLCQARGSGAFANVSDRDLLAYGQAACRAYTGRLEDAYAIAPICPPAATRVQANIDAEEAEFRAEETRNQKVCDSSRHRPRITPVRVTRDRAFTDYGVLESFEYAEGVAENPWDDGVLDKAQKNGLVATGPGHVIILSHSDYDICLTLETYRRRPPLELKGWDHVVEVGYDSLTGHIELMDPISGLTDVPNLAFRGKGHYRIRVHYRSPGWKAWTPQHLLVMVYPGTGRPVAEYCGAGAGRGVTSARRGCR
ncbi:hypothetical protein ACIBK1_35220 [Microbispora rosea]|uniref:hypothetical protein n=1 Tax=Microbispora rosea TaxID=58117 RepID=UPI0012DCF428|nr:hypothetical protein [Microbispora rosea]